MAQRIIVVDAFAHAAYAGNPAAVCVLDAPTTDEWMQAVAGEMNHSETAFCIPLEDGSFELRWFTPTREVKLCGHATLAAAHVLWEEGRLEQRRPAVFKTASGELTASPLGRQIELDFPAHDPAETKPPPGLVDALGVTPTWVGRAGEDYLLQLDTEETVQACSPNIPALSAIETRGVIVTAEANADDVDFVSRFFAPRYGIDEDPVTGSAHCALAPFWAARLDKQELRARQLSKRGGELEVGLDGDRVKLRGTCVTTLRGTLTEGPPRASNRSRG